MNDARILIDATSASIGGGYTYLVNVIPRLCRRVPTSQFRLLLRDQRIYEAIDAPPNLEITKLPAAGAAARLRYIYFAIAGVARQWRADLFFSVGEMAPLRLPCPSIASFRNAFVFTWEVPPSNQQERLRLTALWILGRLSALRCNRIMFVSDDSARWIGDSIRLPASRRAVVHHGIDVAAWAAVEPHRGHPRRYILSVGSIYQHKNFVRLIEAYLDVARRDPEVPDLIIIGDEYDDEYRRLMFAARDAAGELGRRVHILGALPHEEVRSYLVGAELFVFPSYLETFGHPLLEAMAARVPLVASDIPVFREIAGAAAIYADPHETAAFARAIEEALRPKTGAELVRRGGDRVAQFSLDRTVEGLIALFESVLEPEGRT